MHLFGVLHSIRFHPFFYERKVLDCGSWKYKNVLESAAAMAPSSTSNCVDIFSCKPISVYLFIYHRKEDFALNVINVNIAGNFWILILLCCYSVW